MHVTALEIFGSPGNFSKIIHFLPPSRPLESILIEKVSSPTGVLAVNVNPFFNKATGTFEASVVCGFRPAYDWLKSKCILPRLTLFIEDIHASAVMDCESDNL